jgi:OOP family OmpA-OmpF porin
MEAGAFVGGHFFSKQTELGAFPGDPEGRAPKNAFAFGPRLAIALPLHAFAEAELALMPTHTRNGLSKLFIFGWRAHLGYELPLGRFRPFAVLGGGILSLTSSNHAESAPDADFHAHAGLGARFSLSDRFGLRADARALMVPSRSSSKAFTADGELLLGAYYRFDLFRSSAPEVPPAAAEPAAPAPAPSPAPAPPESRQPEEAPAPTKSVPPPEPEEPPAFRGELPTLLFDFGSAELVAEAARELDGLASTLVRHPTLRLEVAGHSDAVGPPELNQALSEQRAEAVASYLSQRGVDRSRLTVKGYGFQHPVAPGATRAANAQNRRVNLRIVP